MTMMMMKSQRCLLAARSCIYRSSTRHCRWHFATSIDIISISLAINCNNPLPMLVTVYTVKYKLGCRRETARSFLSLSQVLRLKLSSNVCQKLMRMCQLSRILWAYLSAWNCLAVYMRPEMASCDRRADGRTDGRSAMRKSGLLMEGLYYWLQQQYDN